MPTASGFFLLALLLAAAAGWGLSRLYSFLSLNAPRFGVSLVIVEGWLPDEELASVFAHRQPGQLIVTTGGPIRFGGDLFNQKSYAELTAERLMLAGEETENILCVPAPEVDSDRTYASALAVRRALEQNGLYGKPCNLYTFGAHARRSLYLYRAALGADYPIGVVSLESDEYDLRRWWTSSLAFKHMMGELISWVYTRCTFWKYGGEPGFSASAGGVQRVGCRL